MDSTKYSIHFHEKSITQLKFHQDGDVFFVASKDFTASMINLDGIVLGSFEKHKGVVSALDIQDNTLVTMGLDMSIILWDIFSGIALSSRSLDFFATDVIFSDQIYFCTDNSMNKKPLIGFADPRVNGTTVSAYLNDPATSLFKNKDVIVYSTSNGKICKLDIRTNKVILEAKHHQDKITKIKPASCGSFFVTSSVDSSSKIIDTNTFILKKVFDTEEPINCASIFRENDKVVTVGGLDARDVTTSKGKGYFETNIFDIVTEQKVGSYISHFGTINTVDVHPNSICLASGGEDGVVSLIKFGHDFYKAPFTCFE